MSPRTTLITIASLAWLVSGLLGGCAGITPKPQRSSQPTIGLDGQSDAPGNAATAEATHPVPAEPFAAPTPLKQLRKVEFQGHHLTVFVDGLETQPTYFDAQRQIWQATGPVAACPELEFVIDREHLGEFSKADVTLHPRRNGETVMTEMWQYTGKKPLQPLSGVKLNRLRGVLGGEIRHGLNQLPPGEYRLTLHVAGSESWDRQYIDFQIK